MGRCLYCFILGFLEFGNLELADGTRLERSGCGFISCRASLGSSKTAFFQASRLRWKIACLANLTREYCSVMGFYGLKRQRDACWKQAGRRGSVTSVTGSIAASSTKQTQTSVKTSVAAGSTNKSLRIPQKSEVRRTYLWLRFNKESIQ